MPRESPEHVAIIATSQDLFQGISPERQQYLLGTLRAICVCMDHDYRVTGLIIGCAIDVHKALGPGLKEQAYDIALRHGLSEHGLTYRSQRPLKVSYEGIPVGTYKPDLIVEQSVVVEIKSVDRLTPVFTSQVLSYLKLTGLRVGLILNFRCARMADGIKRVVR